MGFLTKQRYTEKSSILAAMIIIFLIIYFKLKTQHVVWVI